MVDLRKLKLLFGMGESINGFIGFSDVKSLNHVKLQVLIHKSILEQNYRQIPIQI